MLKKIATILSLIGHPLILGSLVIIFQTAYSYSAHQSLMGSLIVIGGITLPVIIWNFYKTYIGKYSGFDIPLRKQRTSFYTFLSFSFVAVTVLLFITHQPSPVSMSVCFCLFMVLSCFLINFKLKISLHSSTSFFLSFILVYYNLEIGLAMLCLAVLVGWSRRVLHLHTKQEIIAGAIIGTIWGLSYLLVLHYLMKTQLH